ncbi:hypothetical protein OAO87_03055 [bacterium]|nr:hypothetical protein [bacterium]
MAARNSGFRDGSGRRCFGPFGVFFSLDGEVLTALTAASNSVLFAAA